MSKKTSLWAMLAAIIMVVAGVGTYAVIERLSDQAIWVLVGGVGALIVVGGVGVLFIVKDLAHFRIGVKQTGSTDSHDVRAYVQCWNYQSS